MKESQVKELTLPLSQETIESLSAGDILTLTGTIYTARDQAHKKLLEAIEKHNPLPIPYDAVLYYCGPTPAKPNEIIGSCGPTTASRMDPFTPALIRYGLKISIGKGNRDKEVINTIKENKGLYLNALGGCGALYHTFVKKMECIAYPELLSEAIYKLEVENFIVIVAVDSKGNSFQALP
ncbi:FumA C-terminus/TtdB family hydratase beta subunit [Thermoproteota archaeon]